uniref:Segmentation protein cap'n'collar n=1 Tax=Cacopsylla melanoneura TaxID=428564 RepID=A0A8D8LVM7_9HEMI
MIGLKKFVSNELLQIALLLSLLRARNDSFIAPNFECESPTVAGVGGREWNHTSERTFVHNPVAAIHPKSIVNYQEDLIAELNALGRYNRIDFASPDVTAYLLNVNESTASLPLPSLGEELSVQQEAAQPAQSSRTGEGQDGDDKPELSKEDLAIIETLWKEDVARSERSAAPAGGAAGTVPFSLVGATGSNDTDPDPSSSITVEVFETGSGAINGAWPGGASLIGEAALGYNSDRLVPSSSSKSLNADGLEAFDFCSAFDSDSFLAPDTLNPDRAGDIDLANGFKVECKSEQDSLDPDPYFLLVGDDEPLDLFAYPKDEYLIDNALQLCELNECATAEAEAALSIKEEKEESKEELAELDLLFEMMQTVPHQYVANARPYHQSRVPYVRSALGIPPPGGEPPHHPHQRWQDFMSDQHHQNGSYPYHPQYGPSINPHWHHHHHHDTSGAILHNATLPPPMGDLNNTSPYHIGASPNLGGAVTSSINLTTPCDSSDLSAMHNASAAAAAGYKMDNESVQFYHGNVSNQSLTNQTEALFPSILNDEDLQLMDMAMNESMYGNMLENVTSQGSPSSGPGASGHLHGGPTTLGVTHDRCDSDSAVSSMGSERVPSLSSDNEWMETNSDSGHTPGDHYSAEYSKYRWYDNYMYLRSHSMGGGGVSGGESPASSGSHPHRGGPPPGVAQKKYQLYGRRLFHDHNSTAASTSSELSVDSAIKFELNDTSTDSSRLPHSHSLLDEASSSKYNSSDEVKYSSCIPEYSRTTHRPSLSELVSHNHSYSAHQNAAAAASLSLPLHSSSMESRLHSSSMEGRLHHSSSMDSRLGMDSSMSGATSRHNNYVKDKTAKYIQKLKMVDFAARKSEEEQMTRDEKKARSLNIPIPVSDIINLPMDEFNERLSKYDLSETQLSLIRDIRRRGKNKVAAQNCRKRKLDQILSLADEVKQMKDKKRHLLQEHEYLSQETGRVKQQFSQLYKHVFSALRDSDGNPYSPFEFSLEQTNDGNVELVRRHPAGVGQQLPSTSAGTSNGNKEPNSTMEHHQYRSKQHKDYHDHRKE